jgi:ribonucleotide monophosphatase NagD (HAD superfamily)
MIKSSAVTLPIRLLAIDIDGTLLNSLFQIPEANLEMLRQAHAAGIEVVLVTGRRHTFAPARAPAISSIAICCPWRPPGCWSSTCASSAATRC